MGSDVGGFLLNPIGYLSTVGLANAAERYVQGQFDTPSLSGESGQGLDSADIRANTARLGAAVRETYGTDRIFPDLVSQPITRFEDKRRLVNFYFLCVGSGSYSIPQSQITIGETPIASFGTDSDVDIYGPGDSVSDDSRSQIWYQATEVGGTSGGTAGLDLGSTAPSGSSVIADSVSVSSKTATINGPDAEYPSSWAANTIIRLLMPKDVAVGTTGTINNFTGDFQDIQPFVGMVVTLSTPSRDYSLVVASYTDNSGVNDQLTFNDDLSSPFNGLGSGTQRISISYRDHNYQIVSISGATISIDRLNSSGIVDATWTGFDARTDTDFTLTSDSAGEVNWIGPFDAAPSGRNTQLFEYDVYFPSGLISFDSDGDKRSITRTTELQWRDSAVGGAWTTVTNSFTDITNDSIGFTYQISLPYSMRPEVRMRRVEVEGDDRVTDKINWYRLRALMPERPESYAGVTTMAVTIRGGSRLGSQTDRQISCVATRTNNGNEVSSISGAFYGVTDSLGIPRSQIDESEINSLESSRWAPRSETLDFSFTGQVTARDQLNLILGAGTSQLVLSDGLISASFDGIKPPVGIVTPHEQTNPLETSFISPSEDDINAINVEFRSSETWRAETVECRVDGVNVTKIETIQINGVTDRNRAWRIGMRRLRKELGQRLSHSTSTEYDARNYNFLDHILFADDIPGTTQSALVIGFEDNGSEAILSCSEVFDTEGMSNIKVRLRRHNGSVTGLIDVQNIVEFNNPAGFDGSVISIRSSDLDFDPITDNSIEPARVILSDSTRVSYDGTITSIEPSTDGTTRISAIEYSEEFYQDDDNAPPEQS